MGKVLLVDNDKDKYKSKYLNSTNLSERAEIKNIVLATEIS
jgi:hypothetical protein